MTSEGKAAKNLQKKKFPNPTRSCSNMDTNKMEEKNQKGAEFFSWKHVLIKKKLYKIDSVSHPLFFFFFLIKTTKSTSTISY